MYKNSTPWDKLSMAERSDVMNLAIKQGITNLDDIRATYNSFGNGGDKKSKSSYIHDVLPELLRKAGLNIRVTSGYRPAGAVGTAGSKSWHPRHGAVDIVPQGNTTFEDIERVVTTNPEIVRYMTSNGFGFLDETNRTAAGRALMKKTGATGNHFHFGKDTSARNRYQKLLGNTQVTTQPPVNTVPGPSTAAIETQFPQTYTLPTPAPVQMYTPNPLPTPDLEAIEDFYKTTAEKRARREALTSMLTPQQPVAYIPQVQVPQSFLAHPMLQAGNAFGDGGSIHIKPSHRGRFTELKKRTGHSASWFKAHGTPAQKKMAIFALNSKKWKHAFGGPLVDAANAHIYDGTTEDSQQMNRKTVYKSKLGRVFKTREEAVADNKRYYAMREQAKDRNVLAAPSEEMQKVERGIKGARQHAAFAEEHPFLENTGMALGAAPLAVAAIPALETGAEVYAGLPWIAKAVTEGALNSAFAAEGLHNLGSEEGLAKTSRLFNEGDYWGAGKSFLGDALNVSMAIPYTGGLVKVGKEFAGPAIKWIEGPKRGEGTLSPEELNALWDKHYFSAIDAGDVAGVKNLRDAHFTVNAPNSVMKTKEGLPVETYHTVAERYNIGFNEFDPNIEGSHSAIYTSSYKPMSASYSGTPGRTKRLYLNMENPYTIDAHRSDWGHITMPNRDGLSLLDAQRKDALIYKENLNRVLSKYGIKSLKTKKYPVSADKQNWGFDDYYQDAVNSLKKVKNSTKKDLIKSELSAVSRDNVFTTSGLSTRDIESAISQYPKYDGVIIDNVSDWGDGNAFLQEMFRGKKRQYNQVQELFYPEQLKYSSPVTYADDGSIIPLSQRDNFTIKDLRYSLGGGLKK